MRLVFDEHAFEDLAWWLSTDRKTAQKIMSLIQEALRTPYTGRGKPEPLKLNLRRKPSRRPCPGAPALCLCERRQREAMRDQETPRLVRNSPIFLSMALMWVTNQLQRMFPLLEAIPEVMP